jgi:GATA zinc finger domain-containing protein 14
MSNKDNLNNNSHSNNNNNNLGSQANYDQQYQNNNHQNNSNIENNVNYGQQYQNNNQQYSYDINNQQNQNYNSTPNGQQAAYNGQYQNFNNNRPQQPYNNQYHNQYNNGNRQNTNYNNQGYYQSPNSQNYSHGFDQEKKKRSKFVPIISGFLGVVLLSGGGLYYYSKTTNQPLSSIFSFGKKEKEKEIYSPILKKYKEAMDSGEQQFDYEVNNRVIERYTASSKDKDYVEYSYDDIDNDGKNELLIFEKDNYTSPSAIYSYDDKSKINVIYKAETKSIHPTTFYKNKLIVVHDKEGSNDRYTIYQFKDNGIRYEMVHNIDFGKIKDLSGKYKDIITKEEFDSKDAFFKKYPLSGEKIEFSKLDHQSVYNSITDSSSSNNNEKDKEKKVEDKPKYTKMQLALISRAIMSGSTDPKIGQLNYDSYFSIRSSKNGVVSDFGTRASVINVNIRENDIEIIVVDYTSPNRMHDVAKTVTYKEIQETFKKEDMDRINKIIEEYKKTKSFEKNKIEE